MAIWICRCGIPLLDNFQASFARMPHSLKLHVFPHYTKQMYCYSQPTGWKKNALVVGGWHAHLKMGCILLLPTVTVANAAYSLAVAVASLIQMALFKITSIVATALSTAKWISIALATRVGETAREKLPVIDCPTGDLLSI